MQWGLLTMSTEELDRLAIFQKIVYKHLTQIIAAQQLGLTVRQINRLAHQWGLTPIDVCVQRAKVG